MANTIDYVQQFSTMIDQMYAAEAKTYALTQSNSGITFINANTIKIPKLTLSGFKDHTRGGSFNSGSVGNEYEIMKLSHDRDREFVIDAMDVDETNAIVSIANIQAQFEREQVIPEWDAYRLSKLYQDYTTKTKSTADVIENNGTAIMQWFDNTMAAMDDAGVPEDGRILYCTPQYKTSLNSVLNRQLTAKDKVLETSIEALGKVNIVSVPSGRMRTHYDYTDGFAPTDTAGAMAMILVHPTAVIARDKYAYMKAFAPGSDSRTADNWIYQIRKYGDLFLLDNKTDGVAVALSKAATEAAEA
jgi:hypothetical protein